MRVHWSRQFAVIGALVCCALPALAKDGVHAIVHTSIPAHAEEGDKLTIYWTLVVEESGQPFNACRVFVRMTGPNGEATEAFAESCGSPNGGYEAIAEIPPGGIEAIAIGIAGTMTNRTGVHKRSDWMMALANDPIDRAVH